MLRALGIILALTVLLGTVTLVDHARKASAMHRADVAWWYCSNQKIDCGSDPEAVEHRAGHIESGWQQRERIYTLLFGAFIGAGVTIVLGTWSRRRPPAVIPSRG